MPSLWLIPLAPAAAAAFMGVLGGRWFSRSRAGAIASSAVGGSLALSLWASVSLLRLDPTARLREDDLGSWIPPVPLDTVNGVGMFSVNWTVRLDPLAAILLLTIGGIVLLVHWRAAASMRVEARPGYARFFCCLNLFCACMVLLVLGANYLVMFAGWAGAALCSSLLIGFRHEKPHARPTVSMAVLLNGAADAALLLATVFLFHTFGSLDFREVANDVASLPRETAGFGRLSTICLLLFLGAAGKSAQVPLHLWSRRASREPAVTPALVHASIVAAGVYVLARNAVLFDRAPLVMHLAAAAGLVAAAIAATMALRQSDSTRVLAYVMVSQAGFMCLATRQETSSHPAALWLMLVVLLVAPWGMFRARRVPASELFH